MTVIDVLDKGYIRLVNHMGYAIIDMMKTLVPVTADFHWNGKKPGAAKASGLFNMTAAHGYTTGGVQISSILPSGSKTWQPRIPFGNG